MTIFQITHNFQSALLHLFPELTAEEGFINCDTLETNRFHFTKSVTRNSQINDAR